MWKVEKQLVCMFMHVTLSDDAQVSCLNSLCCKSPIIERKRFFQKPIYTNIVWTELAQLYCCGTVQCHVMACRLAAYITDWCIHQQYLILYRSYIYPTVDSQLHRFHTLETSLSFDSWSFIHKC